LGEVDFQQVAQGRSREALAKSAYSKVLKTLGKSEKRVEG
jgi:hypothetical protein